ENGEFKPAWAEVVGVVQHVRYHSLTRQVRPQVYLTYMQSPRPQLQMSFVVRAAAGADSLIDPVRHTVALLDKDLPVSKLRPLDTLVAVGRTRTKFITWLAGFLSLIAVLLAAIGIYGVTSYSVTQSTSEIGVRMALGALRGDILRMVMRQS